MSSLVINLPYPPSGNNLFSNFGKGRVKSPRYREWSNKAAWEVRAQVGPKGIKGPYGLTILAGRPDKRKRDIGNLLKSVEDSLVAGGAVEDDSLCQRVEARWEPGLVGIRAIILATQEAA